MAAKHVLIWQPLLKVTLQQQKKKKKKKNLFKAYKEWLPKQMLVWQPLFKVTLQRNFCSRLTVYVHRCAKFVGWNTSFGCRIVCFWFCFVFYWFFFLPIWTISIGNQWGAEHYKIFFLMVVHEIEKNPCFSLLCPSFNSSMHSDDYELISGKTWMMIGTTELHLLLLKMSALDHC